MLRPAERELALTTIMQLTKLVPPACRCADARAFEVFELTQGAGSGLVATHHCRVVIAATCPACGAVQMFDRGVLMRRLLKSTAKSPTG